MDKRGRYVYRFGGGIIDGDGSQGLILGGKGAGLAEMTKMGLPVPPGFTISTDACRYYLSRGMQISSLPNEISTALKWLENECGKTFGDASNPLLVSVRSGAPISMPGMMDTVLNVGLNDNSVMGLAADSGSLTFALDSYKRLLQLFGTVVLDVPKSGFDEAADRVSSRGGSENKLSEAQLSQMVDAFKSVILTHTGSPFPQAPSQQLERAVEAVFRSWNSERAKVYRSLNNIDDDLGTAVTVQAMVFGNRGIDSGTGVGFTRNPSTGESGIFGEYLVDAQGEDIVAGVRTPAPISTLEEQFPNVYADLTSLVERLEIHYKDVQDFEFTIEKERLYLLQTRAAKRSGLAAVRIAVDLADSGLISRSDALQRVKPHHLLEILSPQLEVSADSVPLTCGLPASLGAAVGRIALSADRAVAMKAEGQTVVLLTQETTAEDIHGMAASLGFLTARGGATSHAAVVARGMGKCCITGARGIEFNRKAGTVQIGGETFCEGDWLSLEGSSGHVYSGQQPLRPASTDHPELDRLLRWAMDASGCLVRANADTPADATAALSAGARGIGLCRTEHMFFAADRLQHIRDMILSQSSSERCASLEHLLPMQQHDFEELFRTMSAMPVTIRLLDPPLHEFLPSHAEVEADLATARKDENWEQCSAHETLRLQIEFLAETNPMMGHRGCRLSLTYPEILQMQVKAILQAAVVVAREGLLPLPEIMVPLVASEQETKALSELIHATAAEVLAELNERIEYKIGAMIELPRAAVCAGNIAKYVSFISFGTNDLTQMTYGFSRDDARAYLDSYIEQGILKVDPFITIDQEGVGYLMKMAIDSVRKQNTAIKIGVCGEHGGDPESIAFFRSLGVDYVSCSPSRLRVAQLAVAQAEADGMAHQSA